MVLVVVVVVVVMVIQHIKALYNRTPIPAACRKFKTLKKMPL
jgi:hypothetical protein